MRKFENFVNAYNNLKDIYEYQEPYGNVELAGLVGLFEVCFEQAWKAMKEVLTSNGFEEGKTGSPRQTLKTAFAAGMIIDEEMWLDAMVSRNNVAHSYNKGIALEIVRRTKENYYSLFGQLKLEIEQNWVGDL